MGQDPREKLIGDLEGVAGEVLAGESPFYVALLGAMAEDVRAGGPAWELLEPFASEPRTEFFPLRALAGVHAMVLAGELPELARHYPSAGGDGDAEAAWPGVRAALAEHSPEVVADLQHPLQTNETSRCGALIGGFLTIARRHPLPQRLLALGASAGLNLHFDLYRYEAGGSGFGPADSPVRFIDYWRGGVPPFDVPLEVAEREGCDLMPIDVGTEAGRLSLRSYVMPDQLERLALLDAALEVAARAPVEVERASADEWLLPRLEILPAGRVTVVFHSVFWIYPPQELRDRVTAAIEEAGARATAEAPLAWLRYEPDPEEVGRCRLTLRSWPGYPEDRLLATGRHHWSPVRWLD